VMECRLGTPLSWGFAHWAPAQNEALSWTRVVSKFVFWIGNGRVASSAAFLPMKFKVCWTVA